eukprot:s2633_g13.t1
MAQGKEERHGQVERAEKAHGQDERSGNPGREETADEMLDRLTAETKKLGQDLGEKSRTRPPDSTRRSSTEREAGEGVKALAGAGAQEVQKPVAAIQAGAGEITQKPRSRKGTVITA